MGLRCEWEMNRLADLGDDFQASVEHVLCARPCPESSPQQSQGRGEGRRAWD